MDPRQAIAQALMGNPNRAAVTPIGFPALGQQAQAMAPSDYQVGNYSPSWRDRLADAMGSVANAVSGKPYDEARRDSMTLMGLAPGTGTVMAAEDAGRALNHGNYAEAGVNALGAIPDGGSLLKAGVAKAIFGGIAAKTADRAALGTAEKMAADGADRSSIWANTGWFQGPDDKWRFEIDDSKSKINHTQVALGGASPDTSRTMSQVLQHENLYDAHPDIGDVNANFRMDIGQNDGTYHTPRTVGNRLIEGISATAPTRNELRSVGLHEAQHAVQNREGFSAGASPTMGHKLEDVWPAAQSAYEDSVGLNGGQSVDDLYHELMGTTPAQTPQAKPWQDLTEREKLPWLEHGRARLYYRDAGEVEARNVQTRMNMTPEQRQATPPWLTQDVPDANQIVRKRP